MAAQIVFNNDTNSLAHIHCYYDISQTVDKTTLDGGKVGQRPPQGTVYVRWSHDNGLPDPTGDPNDKPVCVVAQSPVDIEFRLSEHSDCEWKTD